MLMVLDWTLLKEYQLGDCAGIVLGNFNHVIVESDSSLVVNLIKGQWDDTHSLHGLLLICNSCSGKFELSDYLPICSHSQLLNFVPSPSSLALFFFFQL